MGGQDLAQTGRVRASHVELGTRVDELRTVRRDGVGRCSRVPVVRRPLGFHQAPIEPCDLRVEARRRTHGRKRERLESETESIERPARRASGCDETHAADGEDDAEREDQGDARDAGPHPASFGRRRARGGTSRGLAVLSHHRRPDPRKTLGLRRQRSCRSPEVRLDQLDAGVNHGRSGIGRTEASSCFVHQRVKPDAIVDPAPERLEGTVLDDPNVSFALAEDRPDLGVGELREEAQIDHVPLLRREPGERRANQVDLSGALDQHARLDGIDLLSGLVAKRLDDASSTTEVDHRVSRNPEQPGPERETPLLVARERLDHLEKHLLQEILAVGWLRDTDDDELIDTFRIDVIEGAERVGIAGFRLADQRIDVHVIDH